MSNKRNQGKTIYCDTVSEVQKRFVEAHQSVSCMQMQTENNLTYFEFLNYFECSLNIF